jgi:hypothetical protein
LKARDLIEAIEAVGGRLALNGEKIRYAIPEEAEELIEHLREQKPAIVEILRQRTDSVPWPGYNGGQQFVCQDCKLHFDTSAGISKHSVHCGPRMRAGREDDRT